MPDIPKSIGKYEIQAELGAGGFGRVLRALDPTVPRLVAIKVMTGQGDRELLARFRNEATAAGNLQHKNIVTIYESGDYNSIPYIAMEFLEGEDLQHVIENRRPLTVMDKVSIMSEVAEGLSYAHKHSVVHRDIKPANIMVLSDGRVKIMDFGIARISRENATRLTQKGDMIGTLRYMAPEQFSGGGDTGALCDIFAYGVVYYELLTGRHPFTNADTDLPAFLGRLATQDPPPLREWAPDCPEPLEDILRRALQREPELRYQSLGDLLVDVRPILFELQRSRAAGLLAATREGLAAGRLDADTAQANLRQILELDPSNREALELRPAIQQISVRPRVETILKHAELEISQRRFPEAIQLYESALRLDKQNSQIRQLLDRARAQHEQGKRAARLLAEARQQFQQQDLSSAYRNASEVLRGDPENEQAAELLSTIQREIEQRENRRRFYDGLTKARGLMLLQEFDQALGILGELEGNPEKTPQLAEVIESARGQQAEQAKYQRLREETVAARTLLRESRFEEGVQHLESLAEEFPDAREVSDLLVFAREQLRLQQREGELKLVTEGAKILLAADRFEEARDYLEWAVGCFPGEAELLSLQQRALAACHEIEGQKALAEAVERCRMLFEANRLAEALRHVESSLREHGREPALQEWQRRIQLEWDRQERAEALENLLAEARRNIEGDRADAAVLLLERASIQYPGEKQLSALLVEARDRAACARGRQDAQRLVGESRFGPATEILKNLLQNYPAGEGVKNDWHSVTLMHLEDLRKRGSARDVLDGATELLSSYPQDPQARELRAWAAESIERVRQQPPPPVLPGIKPVELPTQSPTVLPPTSASEAGAPAKRSLKPILIGAGAALILVLAVAVVLFHRQDHPEQEGQAVSQQVPASTSSEQPVSPDRPNPPSQARQADTVEPPPEPKGQEPVQDAGASAWKETRRKALHQAINALAENKFEAAKRALQPVLDHDPQDPEASRLLAKVNLMAKANLPTPPAPAPSPCPPPLQGGAPDPKYHGVESRPVSWAGALNPTCTLEIRGAGASAGGLDPRGNKDLKALPGVRATVTVVSPAAVEVIEQPSERNGFTLKLRNGTGKMVNDIRLTWHDDRQN